MSDETPTESSQTENTGESGAMPELPKADFSAHVYTLAMQALIFMGKQPNPETNTYERNLEIARFQIDTLEMLLEKTKGNLSLEENNLLQSLLHSCRMAYLDESARKP